MEKKFEVVLIDGDILLYKCSAVGEKVCYNIVLGGEVVEEVESAADADYMIENFWPGGEREPVKYDRGLGYCKEAFKHQVDSVRKACAADRAVVYLGKDSHSNFRVTDVATVKAYKGGRDPEKPKYFNKLKEWVILEYSPILSSKIETDDRLCIDSREDFERAKSKSNKNLCKVCVATIDKDAKTVPGWLYNWQKDEKPQWISGKDARHWFWEMSLVGDSVDAIQGCPRIGKVKAKTLLEGCETDEDYWRVVLEAYNNSYKKSLGEDGKHHYKHAYTSQEVSKTPEEIAVEMCTLLHMLRHKDEVWVPPTLVDEEKPER